MEEKKEHETHHEQHEHHAAHEEHEMHHEAHQHEEHEHHEAQESSETQEHKAAKAEKKPAHTAGKKSEHKAVKKHRGHKKVEKPVPPKRKFNFVPYIIGAVVLVIILIAIFALKGCKTDPILVENAGQYGKVDMTFYVMSQCPYGTQVEDAVAPVLAELGENINFRLEFIAGETGPGQFQSLHGPPEVEGDKIQLCVQDKYPKQLIDFVVCQNKDASNLRGSVEKCAEDAGIDAKAIIDCADGEEGNTLLSESIKKSEAANAQGSPTIYVNGQPYQSGRDTAAFKRAACVGLKGHPVCAALPACASDADCREEPGKVGICENPGDKESKCTYKDDEAVTLTVVNAKECADCDPSQLVAVLSQVFLNMEIKAVDASSTEGKSLIKTLQLQKAPAFVFSSGIDKTYAWEVNTRIQPAFRKVSDKYVLLDEASGSTYLLDANKRKEMQELTGVKTGDNKPQIDFYVMSYCPYGNMAEEAIEPVYNLLGSSAEFNPHYVIYSNYQGGGAQFCRDKESKYCSMHGVQELNQGLRELCVHKYMGDDAYFKFVLAMNEKCSSSNADTCWEAVAKSLKLDTVKIKDCEENEDDAILSKEVSLNQALGVSGSPTVFVEGNAYNGARTAGGFAQALCAGFETAPDKCSAESLATLGEIPAATGAAAAGGCG